MIEFRNVTKTYSTGTKAVKNAKPFLKMDKPLYIYDDNGNYTNSILKIYNKE